MENKCDACCQEIANGTGEKSGDLWVCHVCAGNILRERGKTNTQFVIDLMDYSPAGPMMQMVVMQALVSFSDTVVANKEKVLADMSGSFIDGRAWVNTCLELQRNLKDRIGS